jgi:hypothetical protein
MPKLLLVLIIILSFCTRLKCFAEKILGRETDDFDFDGFPGAQHEFKFEIGGGKQECFFQNLAAGGTLHISFQVRLCYFLFLLFLNLYLSLVYCYSFQKVTHWTNT